MYEDALELFNREKEYNKYFFDRGVSDEVFGVFELGTILGSSKYSKISLSPAFPIRDINRELLSIGVRKGLDNLKYYYLPFHKTRTLYGLDIAAPYILADNFAYVVEGIFDVLLMHSYGHKNTIGLMGSSLSTYQMFLLTSLTNNITYIPDMDSPGLKEFDKTKKIVYNLCRDVNMDVIYTYPQKDIADYLQNGGVIDHAN